MTLLVNEVTTKIHIISNITSASWTHVNGGNALFVCFACADSGTPTVTYNSVGLTQVGSVLNGREAFIYQLASPSIGSNTVAVSGFTSGWFIGYAISFANADLSNLSSGFASATGTTTTPSVNVSSGPLNMVIDILVLNGDANARTLTVGAGQTELLNQATPATWIAAAGSREIGAATTTMSWGINTSTPCGIAGVSVNGLPSLSPTTWFFMRETKRLWDNIGGLYVPRQQGLVTI